MQHNTQESAPLPQNQELKPCAYLGKDTNGGLWNHIPTYSKAVNQDNKCLGKIHCTYHSHTQASSA